MLKWNSVYVAGRIADGHWSEVEVVPVNAWSPLMLSKLSTLTAPLTLVTWLLLPDRSFHLLPSQLLAL